MKTRPNQPPFDVWTLGHLAVGGVARALGASFEATMILAIAWEVAEPTVKQAAPRLFPEPARDSIANKAGDIAAFAAGWWVVDTLDESEGP